MIAGPASQPLAVVTGASSGIGYELSVQFAKNGFDLIVAAEDDGVAATARQLEEHGGQAVAVQTDLATYDGVENLYLAIQSLACPIAALAINATPGAGVGDKSGDGFRAGTFAAHDVLADELRLLGRNVIATVHLAKRVVADMIAHDGGKILLTSQVAGAGPVPYGATCAASNAFLRSFAVALSDELGDTPLTVPTLIGCADVEDDPSDLARRGIDALMSGRNHIADG